MSFDGSYHVTCSNWLSGRHAIEWPPLIGYSDTSGVGMGIWFPGEHTAFQCPLPADGPKNIIILIPEGH